MRVWSEILIYFFIFESPLQPEDGGGCVTPSSGGRIRAGGILSGETLSLKVRGKTQPKDPALGLLPSLPRREGHPARHSHVEHGHSCWRFCCSRLFSLPAQSREGNFCDFQLCTEPRCPGTTVVIESRWPFAANAKLCMGNLCKSDHWFVWVRSRFLCMEIKQTVGQRQHQCRLIFSYGYLHK